MTLFDPALPLWRVDAVSILLLVLVVGIAAAVLPFAHRSLRGDRRGRETTVAIAVMLAATAVVSIAGPLWMLAIAWSASTAATLAALGFGGGRPALVRAGPWLVLADLALWGAVVVSAAGGPVDVVALLLVATAVVRCALPPAHVWLVDSLYAPTPVSAALHGGIVNGGGILIITQLGLVSQSALAIIALASVAAIAIVVGVVASLVRTDIKGRLVMSTVAQMGFMLLIAALGLVAAALLHLIAHGFYKSALFLASSDGIDRRAADRRAPRPVALSASARRLRITVGAIVPVAALVIAALAIYPGSRGVAELVVVIVLSVAFATAGARLAVLMPTVTRAIAAVVGAALAAVAFVIVTSLLTAAIASSSTGSSATAGRDVVIVIAFVALASLLIVAALRQWAPASAAALTVLAWGHSIGAPPQRRIGARATASRRAPGMAGAPQTAPSPMGLSS